MVQLNRLMNYANCDHTGLSSGDVPPVGKSAKAPGKSERVSKQERLFQIAAGILLVAVREKALPLATQAKNNAALAGKEITKEFNAETMQVAVQHVIGEFAKKTTTPVLRNRATWERVLTADAKLSASIYESVLTEISKLTIISANRSMRDEVNVLKEALKATRA